MIRDEVIRRSGGRCEAMVALPRTWARCGRAPVEDHHVLTRARGGAVLDSVGEIYHHLALCPTHHRQVDDMGFDSGLLIQGYAWSESGQVFYQGPDEYLSQRYAPQVLSQASSGPVPVSVVREEVRGPLHDSVARGAEL